MTSRSSLRASDADRDAVADKLRHAAVEGRLEPDELEERLHTALRARTYGELNRLLADVPAKPVRWQPRRGMDLAPLAGTMLVVSVRVLTVLAIVSVAVVVIAATLAWWLIAVVLMLALRAGRGCHARRGGPPWHRPPHIGRV